MTPEQAQLLLKRVADLEAKQNQFVFPDRYDFPRTIQHRGSKLGVFNAPPVVKQGPIGSTSGGATVDGIARAAIEDIRTILVNYGLSK